MKHPAVKKNPGKKTKLRIKKIIIENGRLDVLVSGLGTSSQSITLRKIEMTDLGGPAGAAPEQIAVQILNAIASEVSREVAEAGAKRLLDKGLQRAIGQIQRP